MVTPEARDLAKRARHQRTWVHMKVRSVGVRRVWDCMLCACVSEEGEDGEGAGSETPSLLSYTPHLDTSVSRGMFGDWEEKN